MVEAGLIVVFFPIEVECMFNRILLVAVDHSFRDLLAHTLNEEWFETSCADDECSALFLLNETNPELLITEIALPDTSGYELCRHVREDRKFRSLPVVLLDRHFDALNQCLAFEAGADAYLSEPFEPEELIEIVSSLLEGREGVPPDQTAFADSTPQIQAPIPDSHDRMQMELKHDGDPIPVVPQSPNKETTNGLQERVPPGARQGRYFLLRFGVVGAVLAIALAATLLRIYTSSDSTIQQKPLEVEKAEDGAFAVARPQSGEASSEQEASRMNAGGGLRSGGNGRLNDPVPANEIEASRTSPTGTSMRAIMTPKAEHTGGAARQDSSSVAVDRDSADANNDQLNAPPASPRKASTTGSRTIVGHLKRSGQEIMKAGKQFGSGAKHFGESGAKAGLWAGKKVGLGAKRMGTAFKRLF